MRTAAAIAAVVVTLIASHAAHAKCAAYAETLLTSEVVAGSATLVFEIYTIDPDEVPSALDKVAAQLDLYTLQGKKVPLEVRAAHHGMRQVQLELVPRAPLAPGEYRLVRATRPANAQRQSHPLKVIAPAPLTVAAPTITAAASSHEEYGCGPGDTIDLTLAPAGPWFAAATYEHPRYAFVTVTDDHGPTSGYTRVVPSDDGQTLALSVGHGMCSGEFTLVAGTSYRITVQLIGPDGARGPATTRAIVYAPALSAPAPR